MGLLIRSTQKAFLLSLQIEMVMDVPLSLAQMIEDLIINEDVHTYVHVCVFGVFERCGSS